MANYNIDAIYNGNTSLPGTERVRIDSSGNIGIGTATPSTKLHIYENANRVTYISQNNNHTARFEAYGTATAIDTTASNGIFFRINSGDIVKFAADGNVGIGTSTAGAPLHIYRASNPWIRLNGGGAFSYIQLDDGSSYGYLFKNTSSDTTNGALAGAMYTYTDSGKAFQHIHSGTPLFTILSGGNVGIGSTAPAYKLDVNGTFRSTGDLWTNGNIIINRAGAYLYINGTNSDSEIVWQANGSNRWAAGMNVGDATENFNIYNYTTATTNFTILKANGNVGIGSATPGYKLDVNGGVNLNGILSVSGVAVLNESSNANDIYANIRVIRNMSSTIQDGMYINYNSTGTTGAHLRFFANGTTERMRIDANNGNVGIGTTSPSTKLHVVGNADIGDSTDDTGIIIRHGSGSSQYGRIRFYALASNIHTIHSFPTAWQGGTFLNSSAGAINLTGTNGVTFGAWNSVDVAFAANGNNYFKGNVGIGVTTAATKFVVSADATDSDVGQLRVIGSTSTAKMINVGYHTTNNYGFISSLIAGSGYSALSLQPNGGNVGIATVSPDVRLHVVNGTTKLNKNNYKTTTAYSTADLVLGDDISSRTGYAGNGSNLVLHANGTTSITFLDQTRNLGEITYSNRLFTIGGDIGWGTASVSFPGTVNFGTNIYHSIGGQKFFAGSGGNYAYLYTGGVALNFLNSTDTSTLMTVLNDGNVGIGTTSPNKKLQVIGSIGKGYNLYEVPIALLTAGGTQAKRYEIVRVFIDYNDWNSTGPVEIEVRESYYSDGRYKRYLFSYGYNSNNAGSLWLVEDAGRGANDFKAEVGSAVQVSGDIYYVPIYIDIDYYQYVDVLVRTNRTRTTNASSTSGGVIYINESPTGSNISSFSPDEVTYISLASSKTYLGYSGNVGIGTSSPAQKLHIDTSTGTLATRDNGDGALWSTLSTSKTIGLSSGDNYAQSSNYSWMKITGGASGSIQFAVNSLTMTIVDGKVGIGTTSPSEALYVLKASGDSSATFKTASGGSEINLDATNGYASLKIYSSGTEKWRIGQVNDSTGFQIWQSGTGARLYINSSGNVGVGITSLIHKIQAAGLISAGDATYNNDSTFIGAILNNDGTNPGLDLRRWNGGAAGTNNHGATYIATNSTGDTLFYNGLIAANTRATSEKMRISVAGNVGIGTTSPSNKLHVWTGTVQVSGFQSIAAGPLTFLRSDYNGSAAVQINFLNINASNGYDSDLGIQLMNTAGSMVDVLRIKGSSGNVGIGTTSPIAMVHVESSNSQGDNKGLIYLKSTSGNNVLKIGVDGTNNFTELRAYTPGAGDNSKLILQPYGGNVGIGTTNPGAKLVVIGETQISSSSAYTTHLNYQDSGINFITMANSGYTDFRASSNNVTAMRIKGDGNIGVGTTSPTQRLHVLTTGGSTTAPNIVTTFQANTATTILAGGGTAIKFVGVSSGGNLQDYDQGMISTLGYADNNRHGMQFWVKPNASTVLTVGQTIDSNGNVGIGTTSPADKLSIVNGNISLSDSYKLYNGSAADSVGLFFSAALQVNISGYSGIIFRSSATNVSSQAERMRITSDGNIGIGTTSPAAKLDVTSATDTFSLINATNGAQGNRAALFMAARNVNGNVGNVSIEAISVNNQQNDMVFRTGATTMGGFGTERMRIDTTGNVGIGTTSPITKLHVAGTTSIIPTYDSGSGYSYFLRMGYDTSGSYDYTIKRNGTTGFLEFNGTQGSPYVSYVFAGGDVYSGASGGTIGGFYFNSSSHGIRRATGTNDVYCFTTSGTLYLGAGGSSTTHVRVLSGGDVGIGVSPSYKLDVNGNIHGTGFPTSSDVRFKKNITPLQNSLEKIKKLQGVKYEWNEFVNSRRDGYKLNIPIIGLIAQDVEQVVPEIVDHWKLSEDCQDARSIDYPRLIPLLIEAMKEQQNQIEELRNEIKSLKSN